MQDVKTNANISEEDNFYMELLQKNLNNTEYVVGDLSHILKNDINDYTYYMDRNNETDMTSKNYTENMQNFTATDNEEMIQQNNAANEDETVTEVDDSKTKTITLLDFSNYLIPGEETSDEIV